MSSFHSSESFRSTTHDLQLEWPRCACSEIFVAEQRNSPESDAFTFSKNNFLLETAGWLICDCLFILLHTTARSGFPLTEHWNETAPISLTVNLKEKQQQHELKSIPLDLLWSPVCRRALSLLFVLWVRGRLCPITRIFPKFLLRFESQASFQSEEIGSYDYAPLSLQVLVCILMQKDRCWLFITLSHTVEFLWFSSVVVDKFTASFEVLSGLIKWFGSW